MTTKLLSKIFYGVFILCFVIMAAIMVKGLLDQNKDEKQQKERYEKMISEGSKTVLTNEILEEDHDKYLEDASKSRKTFATLLVCFGGVILMFIITTIFNLVVKALEGRSNVFIITLVSFIVMMIFMIGFIVVVMKKVVPRLTSTDYEKEAYAFKELKLKDVQKEKEIVETGSGEDRTTETRVTYFIIEENGNKIEVNSVFYDRFVGPGIYYAGQTEKGNVFSLYPGKFFELPK